MYDLSRLQWTEEVHDSSAQEDQSIASMMRMQLSSFSVFVVVPSAVAFLSIGYYLQVLL